MKLNRQTLMIIFVGLVVLSALLNIGFIGTDEYTEGILRYIPAQDIQLSKLVQSDDVKSPTQIASFVMITQALNKIGVASPEWQYRGMLLILALLSCGVLLIGFKKLFLRNSSNFKILNPHLLLVLFILHPLMIGVLPRPMFEAWSLPFVFLAAVCAWSYFEAGKINDLLLGVLAGTLAFCIRPQVGLINLIFVILPLVKKNHKDLLKVSLAGAFGFILAGLPDYFLRGEFHYSLKAVVRYNHEFGYLYDNKPWWFYFPVLFLLSGMPFLFARYPKSVWDEFKRLRVFAWVALLFLIPHLIFSNKFERFMIPVLPLLILLSAPFWNHLWQNRKKHILRFVLVLIFTAPVWLVAGYFTSQANILNLSFYLNSAPEIRELIVDAKGIDWIGEAFIHRPSQQSLKIQYSKPADICKQITGWIQDGQSHADLRWILKKDEWIQCEAHTHSALKVEEIFSPNLIEKIAYQLNPEKNLRRQDLYLLSLRP